MSMELHVFMHDAQVPTRDAWQQAIIDAGFPTVLDPSFDLRNDTGFSPTTYNDQATGFEFNLDPAAGLLESYEHIADQVGNRDMCASFRWGGDLLECSAAISAAAALTKLVDGVYYSPEDDSIRTSTDVIESARAELDSITE